MFMLLTHTHTRIHKQRPINTAAVGAHFVIHHSPGLNETSLGSCSCSVYVIHFGPYKHKHTHVHIKQHRTGFCTAGFEHFCPVVRHKTPGAIQRLFALQSERDRGGGAQHAGQPAADDGPDPSGSCHSKVTPT